MQKSQEKNNGLKCGWTANRKTELLITIPFLQYSPRAASEFPSHSDEPMIGTTCSVPWLSFFNTESTQATTETF